VAHVALAYCPLGAPARLRRVLRGHGIISRQRGRGRDKAQLPTVLPLPGANIVLLYFLMYR
jgi:hypothetical protein